MTESEYKKKYGHLNKQQLEKFSQQQLDELLEKLLEIMQEQIYRLDQNLSELSLLAKENGRGRDWVYQQMKLEIESEDESIQPFFMKWLDSRLGEN